MIKAVTIALVDIAYIALAASFFGTVGFLTSISLFAIIEITQFVVKRADILKIK